MLGYLAEETTLQCVDGGDWIFAAHRDMQQERHTLKKGVLTGKEPDLEDLQNFLPCPSSEK